MDQYPPETEKQPLIGAEPMLAPEIHPQSRSLAPQQPPPQYGQGPINVSIIYFKFQAEETRCMHAWYREASSLPG